MILYKLNYKEKKSGTITVQLPCIGIFVTVLLLLL
jgi:hypothetical protein